MAKNIKKHNFDIKNFLSKKNLYIHKKFLRIDRLNFLKNLILKKKRLRVLEFGTGISTLIIAKSLSLNKSKFYNKIKDFREENFISYSIDNNKKFLNISKKNINNLKLNKICKFLFVNLQMEIYNGIISSSCNILPNINPDLIILDGPDQKLIKGKSNNINFKDKSFTPIQNDILKMEAFLIPGTIILIDGRTNNAHYFRKKLYRKWSYRHIKLLDQHIFELKDPPIGDYNKKVLYFSKSKNY
jgi:hypothetical protein